MPWGYALSAGIGAYGSIEAGKSSERGAATAAEAQMRGLEYQQEVEALPLEIRNQFLPMLADYYGGGEGQQELIDDVQSSPFYNQMIQSGQEGVLAQAGSRGLTRSGNTTSDLNQSNQAVLQNLVNQRLSGMSSLAQQPLNTNAIAGQMSSIGQTYGAGQIAAGQARQTGYGNIADIMNLGIERDWG